MKSTNAVYELYWKCPHCDYRNELILACTHIEQSVFRSDAEGHVEKMCHSCGEISKVKPAGAKEEKT